VLGNEERGQHQIRLDSVLRNDVFWGQESRIGGNMMKNTVSFLSIWMGVGTFELASYFASQIIDMK